MSIASIDDVARDTFLEWAKAAEARMRSFTACAECGKPWSQDPTDGSWCAIYLADDPSGLPSGVACSDCSPACDRK